MIKNELMSSEESGVNGEGEDITIVHPLPWRFKYCSKMFSKIDSYLYNNSKALKAGAK